MPPDQSLTITCHRRRQRFDNFKIMQRFGKRHRAILEHVSRTERAERQYFVDQGRQFAPTDLDSGYRDYYPVRFPPRGDSWDSVSESIIYHRAADALVERGLLIKHEYKGAKGRPGMKLNLTPAGRAFCLRNRKALEEGLHIRASSD